MPDIEQPINAKWECGTGNVDYLVGLDGTALGYAFTVELFGQKLYRGYSWHAYGIAQGECQTRQGAREAATAAWNAAQAKEPAK